MTTLTRTESETVALVVGAGLVGADDVLGTTPLHQRSLCYRVDTGAGRSLFVKRSRRDADGRLSAAVAHEGRVLQAAHRLGIAVPRPRLVLDDPRADLQLLVTDHLGGRETLSTLRRTAAGRDAAVGAALGTALAVLHATPLEPSEQPALPTTDPCAAVLAGYVTLTPARYAAMSPAARALAGWLQRDGFPELLEATAADWSATAFVHGDVKSDNVLVRTSRRGPDVALVDWELAGWGDPDADLGWLAGDAYAAWLGSIRFAPSGALADWVATATVPLAEVTAQAQAAFRAYTDRRPVAPGAPLRWARYAGLFLLHRACAASSRGDDLTPLASACLHVGGELLRSPERHQEMFR